MAGAYMDPPEERLAYDRDGSVVSVISATGDIYGATLALKQQLNCEVDAQFQIPTSANRLAFVFPLKMDLRAIFWVWADTSRKFDVETSKDTTNGMDGTWAKQLTDQTTTTRVKPDYRDASYVKILPATSGSQAVRGIRLVPSLNWSAWGNVFYPVHIYGYPSSSATTDRLALWHPTNNERLPAGWFDWGNTPRSSSADRGFRIKNLSSSRTAVDVDVYIEALTPGTPSVAGMHVLSNNAGATFQTGLNIPQLDPGQISGGMVLRRVVPANAMLSTWSARLAADVDHWND
jgi:hypothetical protein